MLGGFLRNVENSIIVGWHIEIQLIGWIFHQTWRLVYVGQKKVTNDKWTYDLTDHLMVDLETIIVLASTTYIIDLDDNKLDAEGEKTFNNFINEC